MLFHYRCYISISFIHILQGCFIGTGAIVWLPHCQWHNPDHMDKSTCSEPLQTTIECDPVHIYRHLPWWRHQMEIFSASWPFVRAIHRSRWIPRTKASDAELWCFLWFAPEYNSKAGAFRRNHAHYYVNVMLHMFSHTPWWTIHIPLTIQVLLLIPPTQ